MNADRFYPRKIMVSSTAILKGGISKGDVPGVARLAGIMAAPPI